MIWASEAISRLRELAKLGLGPSRISEQLHVSRNQVAGAMHRYVLADPKPPAAPPEPKWPTVHECHFILDDGPWRAKTPQWCAQRVLPGSPYCPDHHRRCYLGARNGPPAPVPNRGR